MNKNWNSLNKGGTLLVLGAIVGTLLAGCGGGGGGGGTTSVVPTISGTAAGGAPIVGTVQARDSKGTLFGPVPIAADGKYSLTVNGGVAPFIVQASGLVGPGIIAVHSIASSNVMDNLNITPITNMVVADITGVSPADFFNTCTATSCGMPSRERVALAEANMKVLLQDLFAKFGVAQTINLLTDPMVAGPVVGQSPIDKMMDAISVVPVVGAPTSFDIKPKSITGLPATTVLLTVPAPPSGGVTVAASTPLTVDPSLTSTVLTTTTNALTTLQGIQAQFKVMQDLFATTKPLASNTALSALVDASFNDWGQTKTGFINKITGANGAVPGITFTNVVAANARPAPAAQIVNDATHQWFTFVFTNPGQPSELTGPWLAIKDATSGKWLVAGNQMPAPTFVGSYTSSTLSADGWTHVEANTVSGTSVSINHTYTSTANSIVGKFIGTATLTIDPSNNQHATLAGSATLDNYVGSVGGTSNLRTATGLTGELWVQNDGSVNMYWQVIDPLSSTSVGGCSSTLGAGCSSTSGGGSTPPAPAPTPTPAPTPAVGSIIVGSWSNLTVNGIAPTGSGGSNIVITLFANGDYMMAQSVMDGTLAQQQMLNVQPGIEHGTYTWNSSTGAFVSPCPTVDTNLTAGLSNPIPNAGCTGQNTTVTVSGNTMTWMSQHTIPATPITFTRVTDVANPIVGSWSNAIHSDGSSGGTTLEFTFFSNGDYMLAQSVANTPMTQPGLEHGTYTWNSTTGAFTVSCPTVDTNLQAGFSTPKGVQCTAGTTARNGTIAVNSNTMTFNDVTEGYTMTLSRVTP